MCSALLSLVLAIVSPLSVTSRTRCSGAAVANADELLRAVAAVERLEVGERASAGVLAREIDVALRARVVCPDRVRAAGGIEGDRDRVGQTAVGVRHRGAEDAEGADAPGMDGFRV